MRKCSSNDKHANTITPFCDTCANTVKQSCPSVQQARRCWGNGKATPRAVTKYYYVHDRPQFTTGSMDFIRIRIIIRLNKSIDGGRQYGMYKYIVAQLPFYKFNYTTSNVQCKIGLFRKPVPHLGHTLWRETADSYPASFTGIISTL